MRQIHKIINLMRFDVIIIGAGIAGYSAALMLNVYNVKNILIIGKKGGHVINTPTLCNYPGINKSISGEEFYNIIDKQITACNIPVLEEFVKKIGMGHNYFKVYAQSEVIETNTILIATGLTCSKVIIPDQSEFTGKINNCIACQTDNNKPTNKKIIIIGGADNALETALQLDKSNIITIISRSNIKATPTLIEQVKEMNNITIVTNQNIVKLSNLYDTIVVKTHCNITYNCDIIYSAIGHKPSISFLDGWCIDTTPDGFIKQVNGTETSIKNIFACGTVTNNQYTTTCATIGFGSMAATDIYNRINQQKL